jgi:hypothetical protein
VWDLRYPGASTFPCLILWSGSAEQGPLAVPGQYRVRISANGETQTQPLTIRMDPRLKGVTIADLREQFALAIKTRDRTSDANDAVLRIRRLKSAIADRARRANSPDVAATAADVSSKLSAIEEELYQVRNRSGQDPLNFPIKLNNRIAALRRSIETGDAKPTASSYVVFRELSAELDTLLKRLDQVVKGELAAFNRTLGGKKLDIVS